ncbi:MAG: nuclear transport factor 2 family protein [Myxococcales bacterium]|nr:nuclear transport factor 2 family protein [Myxococcales bacterium]
MLTEAAAAGFVDEWIAAWNAHDLERILAHWVDDCVFTSPLAARLLGDPTVRGKAALRAYWQQGLAASPGLRFDLDRVLVGADSLVIAYRNHRGQHVGEWLRLDAALHATEGAAHYG